MTAFQINPNTLADPIINWLNQVVPRIPLVVLGVLVGILVVRLLVRATYLLLKFAKLPKGLRQIIASIIETALWLLLTILVLGWLGFGGIIVFFSSSALAIGIVLAAGGTTLLSDLVAGIFLARDSDFNVGDEVKAGDPQVQGVIESMDVRRVRLRDADGLLHILPNSVIERKEWVVIRRRAELSDLTKGRKLAAKITSRVLKSRKNNQ